MLNSTRRLLLCLTSLSGTPPELRGPAEGDSQAEEGRREEGVREEEGEGQEEDGGGNRGNQASSCL